LLATTRVLSAETDAVTRMALTLTDGSRVLGTCRTEAIHARWEGQEIALRPSLIRRIQMGAETNTAQIVLANGDQMKAALRTTAFAVETMFGIQEIKVDIVRTAEFVAQPAGGLVVEEGLLLYYSFDNVMGERVPDLSGNGNDGTVKGGKVGEGKIGSGMEFARKTDYVEVKQIPGLKFDVNDDATLMLWWKGNDNVQYNAPLLATVILFENFERGFQLAIMPPNEGYAISPFLHCQIKFFTPLVSCKWYHATVVKKGTNWTVYHNGDELPVGTAKNWPPTVDFTVNAPFIIGGCTAPGLPAFSGCIDEVRIYRRALSAEEIRSLFEKK